MPTNNRLQALEVVCTQINQLQVILENLDSDLNQFENITGEISRVNQVFPAQISTDLDLFYSGMKEVENMINELDQITLDKLQSIMDGASKGIETLIAPIPDIVSDVQSISGLFGDVQSEVASLLNPAKGLDAHIKPLDATLASWSNTTPQGGRNGIGTGVLNAIDTEMQRAISDNSILKHKYDAEIDSLVSQLNAMAEDLNAPITSLSTDGGELDTLLPNVNSYLQDYYNALQQVIPLASKVDEVVTFLDKFKPDVDLVYGIVQPLGWFITLIESTACNKTGEVLTLNLNSVEDRISFYADMDVTAQSKFQAFEQWIDTYFQADNIGQKIGNAVQDMLPIDDLKSAVDQLNSELNDLKSNTTISDLMKTFSGISRDIDEVSTKLEVLSTDAKKATGKVTLQRVHPNEALILLQGTRMQTADGSLTFVTTADATFETGSFNTSAVAAIAQSVGTNSNIAAGAITSFVSTPIKQVSGGYAAQGNPIDGDTISVSASTSFTGGTDMSVSQLQGEANALANQMLPTLTKLMNYK